MNAKYIITFHKNADGKYVIEGLRADGIQFEIVDRADMIPKIMKADGISAFEAVTKLMLDF